MASLSRYESYCPRCDVTHPPGTRQCLHCGGRVVQSRQAPQMSRTPTLEPVEAVGEEDEDRTPRPFRIGVALLWILLALLGSLYRICTES